MFFYIPIHIYRFIPIYLIKGFNLSNLKKKTGKAALVSTSMFLGLNTMCREDHHYTP